MEEELIINKFRAWSMNKKEEYFFISQGESATLSVRKKDIKDIEELLIRIKENFALSESDEKLGAAE